MLVIVATSARVLGQDIAVPAEGGLTISDRGPHEQRVHYLGYEQDEAGKTVVVTNSYTQLAAGLNRFDAQIRDWVPASPIIRIVNGKALASETQHQVIWAGDILEPEGTMDMLLPDGSSRFVVQPFGVALTDANGNSVLIGECRSTDGQVVDDTIVQYRDCFAGLIEGSITYENRLDGIEQNVVIEKWGGLSDEDIKGLGVDPSTARLECWTWVMNSAKPTVSNRLVQVGEGKAGTDQWIDLGSMHTPLGKAFRIGESEGPSVLKEWAEVGGLTFLIEQVDLPLLRPSLDALPVKLEARNLLKEKKAVAASGTKAKRAKPASLVAVSKPVRGKRNVQMAAAGALVRKGVVIDYTTVTGAYSNYRFKGSETYYVTGATTFGGNAPGTTFEAGAVIKFAKTNSPKITVTGPIVWEGSGYHPIVMTGIDDSSIGASISGAGTYSSSTRFATIALEIDTSTNATVASIANFRILNATKGISINGQSGHVLKHGVFLNSDTGLGASGGAGISLLNALFAGVTTALSGSGTVTETLEQVTLSGTATFNSGVSSLTVVNSLLVGVTTYGSYSGTSVSTPGSSSGVFTTVGQGQYYLAPGSAYRNAGTTSITIGSELKRLTTDPPVLLTTDFTSDTVLYPTAQRDTDQPDLGFHYWPLDYLSSALNLTNCSLTLTNGTAMAMYGASAIKFRNGSKFYCEGMPQNLNRITRYDTVQEQPVSWGGTYAGLLDIGSYSGSAYPEIRINFTDISVMGTAANSATRRSLIASPGTTSLNPLAISHSQLRGLYFWVVDAPGSGATVTLTNNVLENCDTEWSTYGYYAPVMVSAYNNLFREGLININLQTNVNWVLKDDLFDSDTLTKSGAGTFGTTPDYNGYTASLTSLGGTHNKTGLTGDYVTGPLGRYYYPTSGSNLFTLIDVGSRSSTNATLYHFTTLAATNTVEGTSQIDIGFHYVGVADSSGTPLDPDGDGIPSYLEDRNGNGTFDAGETDWQTYNSGNRLTGTTGLQTFTPLK